MQVFSGMHRGTFAVRDEVLLIKGMIYGDLLIEGSSDVDLQGMIFGNVCLHGGKLLLRGMADGDVTNEGGTLHVTGIVKGRLQTRGGTTTRSSMALCSA